MCCPELVLIINFIDLIYHSICSLALRRECLLLSALVSLRMLFLNLFTMVLQSLVASWMRVRLLIV